MWRTFLPARPRPGRESPDFHIRQGRDRGAAASRSFGAGEGNRGGHDRRSHEPPRFPPGPPLAARARRTLPPPAGRPRGLGAARERAPSAPEQSFETGTNFP